MEFYLNSFLFFVFGIIFATYYPKIQDKFTNPKYFQASPRLTDTDDDVPAHPALAEFADSIRVKGVFEVLPGLHVARGFALANSIMIEGRDGVVIVDTTEAESAAREIMVEFRKITKKPVVGVVYTHFHTDHITGTRAFIEDLQNPPPIYSHRDTVKQIKEFLSTPDLVLKRVFRQIGVLLPPKWHKSSGIGRFFQFVDEKGFSTPVLPTVTFEKELTVKIAGDLEMILYHAPGETDDQIIVWLPKTKVLIPADNIYRAFPNLYAIRGNPARNAKMWYSSIDLMRKLKPHYLVPCHLNEIVGAEEIYRTLTEYRDGIQFLHDQTLRLMNKGFHLDDLQYMIQLPSKLKQNSYLFEHYGTLKWSIKGVFNLYMGWFSGFAEDLIPLPRRFKAQRLVSLFGGVDATLKAAEEAMAKTEARFREVGRHEPFEAQVALELATMTLTSEEGGGDAEDRAKRTRIEAMKALASEQTSANGRNYYLTQALETAGHEIVAGGAKKKIASVDMGQIIQAMTLRVVPEKAEGVEGTIVFNFTDTKEKFVLSIRNCIAETLTPDDPLSDRAIVLSLADALWRSILMRDTSAAVAFAQGKIGVEGGSIPDVSKILSIFEN